MKVKFHGKKEPYTVRGIKNVPCTRCGSPSVHQWNICANDNRNVGMCRACDIMLNQVVLAFCKIPNQEELIYNYVALNVELTR